MLHSAVRIQSKLDNVLRLAETFRGTWPAFVAWVGPHVAGPKDGPAIVPYAPEWLDGELTQPRAAAQHRSGARWSILTLDLDEETDDTIEAAVAQLDMAGVNFLCHSTYSYVPGERMKCRIHVESDTELKVAEVPDARVRLAVWLGVQVDKSTRGGHTLFYSPRCPAEVLPHAFLVAKTNGRPLVVDTLPPAPAAPRAAPAALLTAAVRPAAEWPVECRTAAQEHLAYVRRAIEDNWTPHMRGFIVKQVSLLAGYCASGLLVADDVLEVLEQSLHTRARKYAGDDHTAEERMDQIESLVSWGGARPIVPRGFDPHTGEPTDHRLRIGRAGTQQQLGEQSPAELVSIPDAQRMLHAFLRQPRSQYDRWVGVVDVSVGTGKTHAIRQLAAERAARGEYTVILSLDHGLLGQIRRDLVAAGVGVAHLSSAMQPTSRTGGAECARREEPLIQLLLKSGANVSASVCAKCHLKNSCAALKERRRALDAKVVLAPYTMAERALDAIAERNDSPGAPLLVCDEEPPPPETVLLSDEELGSLARNEAVWGLLREDQAEPLRELLGALASGWDVHEMLLSHLTEFRGQLHMRPGLTMLDLGGNRQDLNTLRLLTECVPGWATRMRMRDHWRIEVPSRVWAVLREEGGFVLTATPNPKMYEGTPTRDLQLRVRDHTDTVREVWVTPHARRSHVMPEGEVNWPLVADDLRAVFDAAPADARFLIGTYKALADQLRDARRDLLLGRNVELIHYEVVRGRDDWRDCTHFVSLYDPLPPPPMTPVECQATGRVVAVAEWSESAAAAARTLTQFHGRARDPQPRAVGAVHWHIGTVPPMDWFDGNAKAVDRPAGVPVVSVHEKNLEEPASNVVRLVLPRDGHRPHPGGHSGSTPLGGHVGMAGANPASAGRHRA